MVDREMVIQHFQDAVEASGNNNKWRFVRLDIIEKAISLLKEHETVAPIKLEMSGIRFCGSCKYAISRNFKFCPNCGKAVKWDANV